MSYIVLGKQDVNIISFFFLFLYINICCGYSLEAPRKVASNENHNTCFHREKNQLI